MTRRHSDARSPKPLLVSIIDDDEPVHVATGNLLRSLGLRVYTFGSVEDFLQSRRLQETACILTDVKMPGMSGVELQGLLIAQACATPIIFLTAFPEDNVRERVLNAGAVGYLSKPFDEQALVECLDSALRKYRHETA